MAKISSTIAAPIVAFDERKFILFCETSIAIGIETLVAAKITPRPIEEESEYAFPKR